MTPSEKSIEVLRSEAQELHRNIVALEKEDKASTRADLDQLQTKARDLGELLKRLAEKETGAVKAKMHEAGMKLAVAREKVETSVHETADILKSKAEHAKATLLEGMTSAVRSLSEAVAAKRESEIAASTEARTNTKT